MKKPKVVIHVLGGVVQGVYSNAPGIAVQLFDFDEQERGHAAEEGEAGFEAATKGLREVALS